MAERRKAICEAVTPSYKRGWISVGWDGMGAWMNFIATADRSVASTLRFVMVCLPSLLADEALELQSSSLGFEIGFGILL